MCAADFNSIVAEVLLVQPDKALKSELMMLCIFYLILMIYSFHVWPRRLYNMFSLPQTSQPKVSNNACIDNYVARDHVMDLTAVCIDDVMQNGHTYKTIFFTASWMTKQIFASKHCVMMFIKDYQNLHPLQVLKASL